MGNQPMASLSATLLLSCILLLLTAKLLLCVDALSELRGGTSPLGSSRVQRRGRVLLYDDNNRGVISSSTDAGVFYDGDTADSYKTEDGIGDVQVEGSNGSNSDNTGADLPIPLPPDEPEPQLSPPEELFPVCKTGGLLASVNLSATNIAGTPWRGWGTSLAWWSNYVGGLPQDQQDDLLDLLFSKDKGLGLNIVRYNIAGGFNPLYSTQFALDQVARSSLIWRGMPGFKKEEGADYNWTSDASQRNCLLGAKARGADTFTAVSYSPPWWATISGDVAGNVNGKVSNLKADYYDKFAEYLADVVKHYADTYGIEFSSLEPVNEANDGGWHKGGLQEGCWFSLSEMEDLYPRVQKALQVRGLHTGLAGFDAWAMTTGYNLRAISERMRNMLLRINSHGYINLNKNDPHLAVESPYGFVQKQAERLNKEVWMSEWTYLKQAGGDLDLGLVLARNIIETVNIMGASAFIYWQAIDTAPRFSIVHVSWDVKQQESRPHFVGKKFWVFKQFTKFAPPGSRVVVPKNSNNCNHCIAAFYNDNARTLAFFVTNQLKRAQEFTLNVDGFQAVDGGEGVTVQVYRTNLREDLLRVDEFQGSIGEQINIAATGRSVTTFVLTNVKMQ